RARPASPAARAPGTRRRGLAFAALVAGGLGLAALALEPEAEAPSATETPELAAFAVPAEAEAEREPRATPATSGPVPKATLPAVVFGEPGAINTPYVPSGYMGDADALTLDAAWADDPRSGPTCLRVSYGPPSGWAGVAWLDPADDWGDRPGGLALDGAQSLTFWARSEREGLEIRIGYGLLLRDVPFFDTSREQGVFRLTTTWTKYRFDLEGENLGRIKSGFYFSLGSPGPGGPHHFYLDDVQYEAR
ncbi:MAG: hypothetical protein AAF447_18120, partial [Myxococcota bacterium]